MSNAQAIEYLKIIIEILIILVLGIFIIVLTNKSLLTINTLDAIKTDLLKSRDENTNYYNYMNIFETYIFSGEYEKAYLLLDEYNAKEKFSSLQDFEQKMNYIYSSEKNYQYNIESIVEKDKYKDAYMKVYLSYKDINKIDTSVIEFMIREYSAFDYKIYLRTEINN